MKKTGIYSLSVILLLALWQGTALWINKEAFFPGLPALFRSLGELLVSSHFRISLFITICRGLSGICLSFLAAILFSILFVRHTFFYELFRPVLSIMRSVPVISFILLALLFLNPEIIPLFIGFLTMFPILTENLTQGLLHMDKNLLEMGKLFSISRLTYQMQIVYPQLKPFLYSGLATATGFGWRAIIMGEVLAQCSFGIGSEMKRAQVFIAIPELLAWTAVAVFIGFVADKGINRLYTWCPPLRFTHNKAETHCTPIQSPILVKNVSFRYGSTPVLKNLCLEIPPQQITGISAPSGAGKTTLFHLLSGVRMPSEGAIIRNTDIRISFVFQEPRLLPHLSILENCMLPLAGLMPRKNAEEKALELLKIMGLEEKATAYPGELSYGQQQRVAIARALAYPAPLLLMDEPFKGLDQAVITHLINYIKEEQRRSIQTILFTSHHPEELEKLAEQTITL